jgi:hypothetical protein
MAQSRFSFKKDPACYDSSDSAAWRNNASTADLDDFPIRLGRRFRRQQAFAAGYALLCSRVFGLVADWLEAGAERDAVATWLLVAARGRATFEVPLLLLAGLHREVLTSEPTAAPLARYFPSVGGDLAPDEPGLAAALRATILALRPQLTAFLREATVQTNETARGLCWLLPVCYPGWPAFHLIELGASAGLNLVADWRAFRLTGANDHPVTTDLGRDDVCPFIVRTAGDFVPYINAPPRVLSRTGCDLAPLELMTERAEQTLAAFVWTDQLDRMKVLRRGIATLHRAEQAGHPVRLHRADLPDDLIDFLSGQAAFPGDAPVIIFNTYLTTYLHDRGAGLRPQLAAWAAQQRRPVLWLQWETLWQGPQPPEFGWLGWTADLWQQGRHHHWQLAWVQPHGARVLWLHGLIDWAAFWRRGP